MDAKKFLELQTQIKQNNQEYLEFVSDLDSWKSDLEKKHERQQRSNEKQPASGDLPPVRNSLLKKKMKKKAKKKPDSSDEAQLAGDAKVKKISAYDYRAWDKFDVDKACESVDNSAPSHKSDESEYETDEEWEEERRKQLAESKKLAGNEAFKSQKFPDAVELYTKAIQLNPDDAVYYCNRAMAQLKLEKYGAAESDCNSALELDSKMVKAYYRRGQARQKLDKLPEALRDLEEALAMEPGNRSLQSEVADLRLRLHPEKYATGVVQPIFDKPLGQRSAKPLVRVPIQEVSAAKSAAAAALAATTHSRQAGEVEQFNHQLNRVADTKVEEGSRTAVAAPSTLATPQAGSAAPPSALQASPPASAPATATVTAAATAPPETPFQFKTAHRSLARRDPLAFCTDVLCAIDPPERLPALIGESLESDTLLDMAAAFTAGLAARPELAGRVFRCLRLVADRVKRFATCVAFLSAAERGRLADLMRALHSGLLLAQSGEGQSVRELAAVYGVPDCLD